MSANLRSEFEEYVKKLTTEISKEIFFQQLSELYKSYESNLQQTLQTTTNLNSAVQNLSDGIRTASSTAAKVQFQSKASLQEISKQLAKVEEHTDQLFATMQRLSKEDRQALLSDLDKANKQYASVVQRILASGCASISDKLGEVITVEQLRQFQTVLEQNTRESLELAKSISGILSGDVEEGLRQVQEAIRGAVDAQLHNIETQLAGVDKSFGDSLKKRENELSQMVKTLEERLHSTLEEFRAGQKKDLEESLRRQKELIGTIGPDKEEVDRIVKNTKHISDNTWQMMESARQLQLLADKQLEESKRGSRNVQEAADQIWALKEELPKQFENNEKKIQAQLDAMTESLRQWREEDRRAQAQTQREIRAAILSLRLTVIFSTIFTIILFVLLVFQKPWEAVGMDTMFFISGGILLIFVFLCLLAWIIGKAVAGRRETPAEAEREA